MPDDFSKFLSVTEVEGQLDQDLPSIVISQFLKQEKPLVKQFLQNLFQAEKMCTQTYYYKTKKTNQNTFTDNFTTAEHNLAR